MMGWIVAEQDLVSLKVGMLAYVIQLNPFEFTYNISEIKTKES